MSEIDALMWEELDRLAPLEAGVGNDRAAADRADWAELVRRAQPPRRRKALAVALVGALLTIAIATPAFGLGGRVLDLFQGTPAPSSVKESFVMWNKDRSWMATLRTVPAAGIAAARTELERVPTADPSKAHGVVAVQLSRDVTVQFWAAPLEGGGECAILVTVDAGGNMRGGANGHHPSWCVTSKTPPAPRPAGTYGFGAPGRGVMPGVAPGAASVELRFGDGRTIRAPVVEGFFLAPVDNPRIGRPPVPRTLPGPGVYVTGATSYDEHGNQLAEMATPELEVIADYLGISFPELWAEFPTWLHRGGTTTLAQVAVQRGRTAEGLVDAIIASAKTELDAQVATGQLTAADAASRLAARRRSAEGMVHAVPPAGRPVSIG